MHRIRYSVSLPTSMAALLAAVLLAGLAAAPAAAQPRVVASLKPVHSLVAGVMQGVGEPTLLVEGAGSPHTYSMRPSDARAVSRADAVFWMGPALEAFLVRPLEGVPEGARVVALSGAAGVRLLPTREGGVWGSHEHEEESHDHGEHAHEEEGHDHGERDMHVWLSPANARAMVEAIAGVLAEVDPANAATYRRNASRYAERIDALDAELRAALAPVREVPYIVFHDAYQYFERAYGLRGVGTLTVSPQRSPGVQRVADLRALVRDRGARCVFAEPQFEPRLVRTVVANTPARSGELDPLGSKLAAGPQLYFELMRALAQSMRACLEG